MRSEEAQRLKVEAESKLTEAQRRALSLRRHLDEQKVQHLRFEIVFCRGGSCIYFFPSLLNSESDLLKKKVETLKRELASKVCCRGRGGGGGGGGAALVGI